MAIWQYSVYLIPRANLAADGSLEGLVVMEDSFDHPPLIFRIAADELENAVAAILPPTKSWDENMHKFGDEQTHDVDVWYKEDRIASVRIRLDLRARIQEMLRQVVALSIKADCVFWDPRTLKVFPAEEIALIENIRTSRPANFIKNPTRFLELLDNNGMAAGDTHE